jgi:hydroxymethylbilane synthase
MTNLRIGTRGSALAMWQAEWVRDALTRAHPGLEVSLEVIRTTGDRVQKAPLPAIGATGLFTKEIEAALLAGEVDLAVHSLKDLPTRLADGLALSAVPAREDPADALVAAPGRTLETLPEGGELMTGSLRRRAQVLHRRPDLSVSGVRGNVQTRLRKFDESGADAIVLARAGLVRLGLAGRIAERLTPAEFVPAPGQGALGVETRADDEQTLALCRALDVPALRLAVSAERAFLAELGGGCQVPIGAYADWQAAGELTLTGMVAGLDGTRLLRRTHSAPAPSLDEARELGRLVAEILRAEGCQEILDEVAGDQPPRPGGSA